MNQWMNEWTNEWLDEWVDGWIDRGMSELRFFVEPFLRWTTSSLSHFFSEQPLISDLRCLSPTSSVPSATQFFCSRSQHSAVAQRHSQTTFRADVTMQLATCSCRSRLSLMLCFAQPCQCVLSQPVANLLSSSVTTTRKTTCAALTPRTRPHKFGAAPVPSAFNFFLVSWALSHITWKNAGFRARECAFTRELTHGRTVTLPNYLMMGGWHDDVVDMMMWLTWWCGWHDGGNANHDKGNWLRSF